MPSLMADNLRRWKDVTAAPFSVRIGVIAFLQFDGRS